MDKHHLIPNRIHIIGSIGSGKTTLAKVLSKQLNIPYYELDNVVRKRLKTGDIKRTDQERDEYLISIISSNHWIVEGVHHKWVSPCFESADIIIFLDTNLSTRRFRIIKRYIKQKMGIEKSNYKPTFKILQTLYKYNTEFDTKSKPEIFDMLSPYKNKLVIIKSKDEMIDYLNKRGH